MAKAKAGGPDQVAADMRCSFGRLGQCADDLKEGLIRAEVFLALIAGQFQRDDRARQTHGFGHAAGIVLDQLGGARGTDDHRLRLEPVIGSLAGGP